LFVPLAVLTLTAQAWNTPKPPVCIIGAGPSGLTAANRLESKGYETVIFDNQAKIGGKCQAYYEK
jgi:cation diffusion facilitator CzcD-associated flavoprotein CzcO